MKQKGFSLILLVFFILVFLGVVAFLFMQNIRDAEKLKNMGNNPNFGEKTSQGYIDNNLYMPASTQSQALANPASVNCGKVGGTLAIQTMPSGGQVGICNFKDNQSCEEWALFYGNCPVGGVKTIGFDTPAQVYCAQLGGQTLAIKDATCTLPSGKVCNDEDLYNGECDIN